MKTLIKIGITLLSIAILGLITFIVYHDKADSLFVRMDDYESPTAARKIIYSRHIDSLEAIVSWDTIDILYSLAAHDLDVSLLNWARLDTFNAEAIDHPTFAEDTGWTGDGSAAYINTSLGIEFPGFETNDHGIYSLVVIIIWLLCIGIGFVFTINLLYLIETLKKKSWKQEKQ